MAGDIDLGRLILSVVADARGFYQELDSTESALSNFARRVNNTFSSIGATAAIAFSGVAVGIAAAVGASIKAQDQFTALRKTLDLSEEQFQALHQSFLKMSSEGFLSALPDAYEQLTKIAAIAGQLGIQSVAGVENFTSTIGHMLLTTDMSAERAATSLGRFLAVTNTSAEQSAELGNVITHLGNKMPVFEEQIMEAAFRIGGAGQVAGMSADEILALAAAYVSSGSKIEAGGSAISLAIESMSKAVLGAKAATNELSKEDEELSKKKRRLATDIALLTDKIKTQEYALALDNKELAAQRKMWDELDPKLQSQIKTNMSLNDTLAASRARLAELREDYAELSSSVGGASKELQTFADVAGITTEEFAKLWEDDPTEAMIKFIEGLAEMSRNGEDLYGALEEVGLGSTRATRTFLLLSQAVLDAGEGERNMARAAVDLVKQTEALTAMTEEARKRFETTASQLRSLRNWFLSVAIAVGDKFRPAFDILLSRVRELVERWGPPLIEWAQRMADWFMKLDAPVQNIVAGIFAVSAGIGTLLAATAVMHPLFYRLRRVAYLLTPMFGKLALLAGALAMAWQSNFLGLRDFLLPMLERLKSVLPAAISTISEHLNGLFIAIGSRDWAGAVDEIGFALSTVVGQMLYVISNVDPVEMTNAVYNFFATLAEAIRTGDVTLVHDAMKGLFIDITNVLLPGQDATDIAGAARLWLEYAKNWYAWLRDTWLPGAIQTVAGVFASIFTGLTSYLLSDPAVTDASAAKKAWETWALNWYAYIRDVWVPAASQTMAGYVGAALTGITNYLTGSNITDPGKVKQEWINWWFATGKPAVVNWSVHVQSWWAGFYQYLLTGFRADILAWTDAHKDTIATVFLDVIQAIVATAAALISTAGALFEPLYTSLLDVLGEVMDKMRKQIERFFNTLQSALLPSKQRFEYAFYVPGKSPYTVTGAKVDMSQVAAMAAPFLRMIESTVAFIKEHSIPLMVTLARELLETLWNAIVSPTMLSDMGVSGSETGWSPYWTNVGQSASGALVDGMTTGLKERLGGKTLVAYLFEQLEGGTAPELVELNKTAKNITEAFPMSWGIPGAAMWAGQGAANWIKNLFSTGSEGATAAEEAGAEMVTHVGKGIAGKRSDVRDWADTEFATPLSNGVDAIVGRFQSVGEKIWGGIRDGLELAIKAMSMEWVMEKVREELDTAGDGHSPYEFFSPVGANIIGGVVEGMVYAASHDIGGAVGGATQTIGESLSAHIQTMVERMEGYRDLYASVVADHQAAVDAMEDAMDGAVSVAQDSADSSDAAFEDIWISRDHPWAESMTRLIGNVQAFLWDAINLSRGIGQGLLEDAQRWASAASGIASAITSAIDAIDALSKFKGVPGTARAGWAKIRGFLQEVFNSFGVGLPTELGWGAAPEMKVSERVAAYANALGSIASMMGGAVDAISKIKDFKPIANFSEKAVQLADYINIILKEFDRIVGEGMGGAATFSESITGVMSAVAAALETVTKLGAFGVTGDISAKAASLVGYIIDVVNALASAIESLPESVASDANEFVSRITNIISAIGPAVDALVSMQEWEIGQPIAKQAHALAARIVTIANELALAAERIPEDTVRAAAEFASNVGEIVSIIRTGIDALIALEEWTPGKRIAERTRQLAQRIANAAIKLANVGANLPKEVTDAAKDFVDRVKEVVGFIGGAIAAVMALEEWKPTGTIADKARELAADIVTIATEVGLAAGTIESKLLDAAAGFAEDFETIASAVSKGLVLLDEMRAWKDVLSVQDKMEKFVKAWVIIIEKFHDLKEQVGWMLDYDVRKFAQILGEVVDTLSKAVSLMKELKDFVAPTEEAAEAFLEAYKGIFEDFRNWVTDDLGEVDSAILDPLAQTMGNVFDALKSASDLLTSLVDYISPGSEALTLFRLDYQRVFRDFVTWISLPAESGGVLGLDTEVVDRYAITVGNVFDALKSASDLLASLVDYVSPGSEALAGFKQDYQKVFRDFVTWISLPAVSGGVLGLDTEVVDKYAITVGNVFDGLKSAAELLATLVDYVSPGSQALLDFTRDYQNVFRTFVTWISTPATGGGVLGLDTEVVDKYATTVGNVFNALTAASDLLASLVDYTSPGGQALLNFTRDYQNVFRVFVQWIESDRMEGGINGLDTATADKYATTVGNVFNALKSASELLISLADYTSPGSQELLNFTRDYQNAFRVFVQWVESDRKEGGIKGVDTDTTDKYATTVGNVFDALVSASELLIGLDEYTSPGSQALLYFTRDYQNAFRVFVKWVESDPSQGGISGIDTETLDKYTTTVGAVFDALTSAADLLEGLQEYKGIGSEQLTSFVKDYKQAFSGFYDWVTGPPADGGLGDIDTELLAPIADAIGSVFDALVAAAELLGGLTDYVPIGVEAIQKFETDYQAAFAGFYTWVTSPTGGGFTEEGTKIAQAIADAMGSLFDALGAALGVFTDLRTYVSPLDDAVGEFIGDVEKIFTRFYNWVNGTNEYAGRGANFTEAGLAITQAFGDAAGALFSALESAVKVIAGVGALFHPAEEKLRFFMGQVQIVFTEMHGFAQGVDQKQLEITNVFSGALEALVGALGSALSLISRLEETPMPELGNERADSFFEKKVSHFIDAIDVVVGRFGEWIEQKMTPDAELAVLRFTNVLEEMVGGLGAALDFLLELNDADLPSISHLQSYLGLISQLFFAFVGGIQGTPEDIIGAGDDTAQAIGDAANNISVRSPSEDWRDLGFQYISKLREGLTDPWELSALAVAVGGSPQAITPDNIAYYVLPERLLAAVPPALWADVGAEYMHGLVAGMASDQTGLLDAMIAITTTLSQLQTPGSGMWIYATGFSTGASFTYGLADGIVSADAIARLREALETVLGYFPQSPAKYGPFRKLPTTDWVDDWFTGASDRFGDGIASLSSLPGISMPGVGASGAASASNAMTFNINVNGGDLRSRENAKVLAQEIYQNIRRDMGLS